MIASLTALMAVCTACNNNNANNSPTTPETPTYSNEVQVVVLLGQSNAEGHTWSQYLTKTVGTEKAKEYADGYDNVKISYACTIAENTSNGEFVPVKLGQGHSVNQFGPEIGMAEKFPHLTRTSLFISLNMLTGQLLLLRTGVRRPAKYGQSLFGCRRLHFGTVPQT